jgi:branched-subunit amino acid ABC-type transport system permease component
MTLAIHAFGFGLVTASVLAIAAVGLTLQFGVTNYVNFAYGDFMTLGAYLTWTLNAVVGVSFWPALVLGALLTSVAALIISQVLLEPFVRRRGQLLFILIVTFALSLILSNAILAIWGGDYHEYDVGLQTPLHIGPLLLSVQQLGVLALAVVSMLGIHLLLTRTNVGKAMRAISDDKSLAEVAGIATDPLIALVWLLSGFFAGLAGGVLALTVVSFDPNIGVNFLFVIFAAVILGGIGRPYGAMLGALVIGLAVELSVLVIPAAYKLDVAFLILVVVLLIRPQGILAVAGKV